jgi:hypothetical protein
MPVHQPDKAGLVKLRHMSSRHCSANPILSKIGAIAKNQARPLRTGSAPNQLFFPVPLSIISNDCDSDNNKQRNKN